jgi:serine/threonine protein kinase
VRGRKGGGGGGGAIIHTNAIRQEGLSASDGSVSTYNGKRVIVVWCRFLGACMQVEQTILVMEYMPGGDLLTLIENDRDGSFRWSGRGRSIGMDVAKGLAYLHSNNMLPPSPPPGPPLPLPQYKNKNNNNNNMDNNDMNINICI